MYRTLALFLSVTTAAAVAPADCKSTTLDFIYLEGDANQKAIVDDIAADLIKLGITAKARGLTQDERNGNRTAGNFDMSLDATWGNPYDPHSYLASWKVANEAHHTVLEKLPAPLDAGTYATRIDAILGESDAQTRQKLYASLLDDIHQAAIHIPLYGQSIPSCVSSIFSLFFSIFPLLLLYFFSTSSLLLLYTFLLYTSSLLLSSFLLLLFVFVAHVVRFLPVFFHFCTASSTSVSWATRLDFSNSTTPCKIFASCLAPSPSKLRLGLKPAFSRLLVVSTLTATAQTSSSPTTGYTRASFHTVRMANSSQHSLPAGPPLSTRTTLRPFRSLSAQASSSMTELTGHVPSPSSILTTSLLHH